MKKSLILFDFLILMFSIQLCMDCPADTPPPPKAENASKQGTINPADVEVIKNLDMLKNWDIVGPNGPDLNKGVSYAK